MIKGISENFTPNLTFNLDDPIFYVLPPKGEISFKGIPQIEEITQNDNIQQPLKSIANELCEKTIHIRQSWMLSKQNYHFKIPPSYFKKQIIIQRQDNEHQTKKQINQYDFVPYVEFNNQQINQIRLDGTFDVCSKNNRDTKYRWIISRWIVKGTRNIRNSFYKDMLKAQDCLTGLGDFIYNEEGFDSLWNFSIVHGLYVIFKKLILIPSVFIGYREVIGDVNGQSAELQTERERQLSLIKKNLNFSIYEYLVFTKETQNNTKMKIDFIKDQLKQFEQDCWKIAQVLSDMHLNRNHQNNFEFRNLQEKYQINFDPNKDIDELISEQLYIAQQRYCQTSNLDIPQAAIKQILDIIECYKLQRYYQEQFKNELANYENQINQQYERTFFFLKKESHRINYINDAVKQRKKILKKNFESQMIQELSQKNIVDRNIYIDFIKNKHKYKNRIQEIKRMEKAKQTHPNITNRIIRLFAPPYQIMQKGNKFYFLESVCYEITSKYYFWKFTSFCMFYFILITNSYYIFNEFGIKGPYGLKALFQIEPFYNDQVINQETGEVTEQNEIQTICSTLKLVYKGMKQSRLEFEESEDYGMFGKSCLRPCNLIEVYIFRFLFVGVFCTLILRPIITLLLIGALFFILITSLIWGGLVAMIKWMICILFYDFDTVSRKVYNELDYIHFCAPLFRAMIDIMIGMMEIIVCMICLMIFPVFALLILLFGIIRYTIRSIYDCFMMTFVYCCGRVPYRSGCLVWRIGGDDTQKKILYNYHKLDNVELQLLAARELEKYILQEYKHRIVTTIEQPEKDINRNLQPFFNNFNAKYQCDDRNSKLLLDQVFNNITTQISLHPEIDPKTKKYIKYSQDELYEVKLFIKSFLIEQINMKNMHSFIWKSAGLQIGEYSALVDIILCQIFGIEISNPKGSIVREAQIRVEKEQGFGEQIERAMNGKVNLNQPAKYVLEEKKELQKQATKKVYQQFIPVYEMLNKIWMAQSPTQEWSSLKKKDFRFLLNYSLKR